jgi:hypothetical protein
MLVIEAMRAAATMVITAACSSPTFGPPVTCDEPISSVCSGSACQTVDEAINDDTSCDAGGDGYAQCGGWTIVYAGDMEPYELFFFDGTLVASLHDSGSNVECSGPSSFSPPSCPDDFMLPPNCQ